ncbi:MAG: replication restart helicase PriA [Planctomycetota bacterium]|jgi:primosomal protein N' (replication factor Y)
MREGAADGGPAGLVLEGVTGSGKTEVYLRAIAEEVASGRQAIVLVPEIALTPQTIRRFGERFDRLAVLHSHLTEGARADEWRRVKRGEVDVVIGARSALFAPTPALGLIVVDEEHETSYKQDSSPRYHARDAALERARIEGASVVLGSATPSLESYHAARDGRLLHAVLPERVGSRPLPPVEVVDMRAERALVKGHPILSGRFVRLLKEAVSRDEQAILFLNRRGYATFLRCARCGEDIRCGKCDVPLVFHKSARSRKSKKKAKRPGDSPPGPGPERAMDALRCHYCGEARPYPEMCPECGGGKLLALGTGTERVVDEIRRAVDCRIARMDADAMSKHEDYERVLADFREGRLDCLVGTQMIAKGIDLPRVTFVGVVNADVALHLADFRASERAFQLIAQVAGRTGRSDLGGRVVVQTELPESLPVRTGAKHDMQAFASEELEHRREFAYPPFTRLARVVVEGPREEAVEKKILAIAKALAPPEGEPARHSLLGPAEAPLGKLKGRRRQHLIVKAADSAALEELLWGAERALRSSGKTRVVVDVDPVNMR